jgi:hypothetical protein
VARPVELNQFNQDAQTVGVLGSLVGVPDAAHLLHGRGTHRLQDRGLREAEGDWIHHLLHWQAARCLAQGHGEVELRVIAAALECAGGPLGELKRARGATSLRGDHGLKAHPLCYIDYEMLHTTCSTRCRTRLIPQIRYSEIPNKIYILLHKLRLHYVLLSIVFALQLSNQTPPKSVPYQNKEID